MRRMMLVLAVACLTLFGFAPIAKADTGTGTNTGTYCCYVQQMPGAHVLSHQQLVDLNTQVAKAGVPLYVIVSSDKTPSSVENKTTDTTVVNVTFEKNGIEDYNWSPTSFDATTQYELSQIFYEFLFKPPTAASLEQFVTQVIKAYPTYTPNTGYITEGDVPWQLVVAVILLVVGVVFGYVLWPSQPSSKRQPSA